MTTDSMNGRRQVKDQKMADLERDMENVQMGQTMTSDHGVPISNTDKWLRAVDAEHLGPTLLEDQMAREKIHRFDHERIPERVVHARGTGAFGTFTLKESAEDVSYAGVLTDTSRKTPVFLRFSTVQGSKGSADTVRDVRGFAVKFYTEEGNWDIVGNNIPVFFIQDAVKFPDIIHSVKPEPHNEIPQGQSAHNNFWDFISLHSESTHMFNWVMSDRAIPRSYRMMQGFGVNTYSLINKLGKRHLVKFHWIPHLGVHSLVWDEALKLGGQDPDFHRRDLMEAIENKAYPKWDFGIQVIPEEKQNDYTFDPLDATKLWPEDQFPVRILGELELNRNVDEFFPQTEQAAFCTSHVVPGIDFSDDPLLQGRNFSYFDTQVSRLGVNWEELPINRPVCPVLNHHRDGAMRHKICPSSVNYWPNRFQDAPPAKPAPQGRGFASHPQKFHGFKQQAVSHKFQEHHSQAQLFYNSLSEHEKLHLTKALSFELDHCDDPTVCKSMVQRLAEIDLSLAQKVAEMAGAPVPTQALKPNHGNRAPRLSQMEFPAKDPRSIATRRVAIIISDGYDRASFTNVKNAITSAGALPFVIGTKRQPIVAEGQDRSNESVVADHHYDGQRSTMFDATFVPGGAHIETLSKIGPIRLWISETFGHLKAVGATGEAIRLVKSSLTTVPGLKVSSGSGSDVTEWYGVVTSGGSDIEPFLHEFFGQISQHRNYRRELDGLASTVGF